MTMLILDMPDSPKEIPRWLEDQLVSTNLAAIVSELTGVHQPTSRRPQLAEVLPDEQRARLLAEGLGVLLPEQIQVLLQHPTLLFELQELIVIEGGAVWNRKLADGALADNKADQERLDRTWNWLCDQIDEPTAVVSPSGTARIGRDNLAWFGVGVLIATVLLCVVWISTGKPQTASAWGWQAPDALQPQSNAADYLDRIADHGNQWFQRQPTTPQDLAQRMVEFRAGCSRLILDPHSSLAPSDRQWLVERCRTWAAKFDLYLTSIESGEDVDEVRRRADGTVQQLILAIKNRAVEVRFARE